jgi:trk system potassium uptake protein
VTKLLPILNVLGLMLIVFSVTYAIPLVAALVFDDGTFRDFVEAGLMTLAAGALLWFGTRKFKRELKPRDGYLLVVLGWVFMAGIATLPLLLHIDSLSFTDAFFETMSGLSTTGATVLTGLDALPPAINLWRHELNWLGGMGIIVLAVAILPLLGVGGMQMFKAETPGPFKDSKLTPRIAETAKALWYVYAGITLVCILALKCAGMNWLDAICHAFAAMGLGGFSTHDASVGYFNSPAIEAVLVVFMLIAGMNFATHFVAVHGRSLRIYLKDMEARAFVILTLGSCIGVAIFLWATGTYPSLLTALRHASFNLVSLATDCGFVSVDFNQWPIFAPLWMLFLSCIAVSSGSTGGGIKMVRTLLLIKQAQRELTTLIHPNAVTPLRIGSVNIPENAVVAVLGFIFLYFMSIVVLTFTLMASGLDFLSSFTAIVACINNAGPGLNLVGPASNYGVLSAFQTWVCSIAMLLGRLEVFTLLVLFTPAYWRK